MPVGACGICCDVCGLYLKGICKTCAAGTDERAREKLQTQIQSFQTQCPVLACAVEKRVGYCLKDCQEFPCAKFESGFESIYHGTGAFPYGAGWLEMFKRRLGKK